MGMEKGRKTLKTHWMSVPDIRWEEDSLAVVACRDGIGCVLWYGGGLTLDYEIREAGLSQLDDLGLDDAPDGISVWVGRYVTTGGGGMMGVHEDSIGSQPAGKFRAPTGEEWASIKIGRNPWPRPKEGS